VQCCTRSIIENEKIDWFYVFIINIHIFSKKKDKRFSKIQFTKSFTIDLILDSKTFYSKFNFKIEEKWYERSSCV